MSNKGGGDPWTHGPSDSSSGPMAGGDDWQRIMLKQSEYSFWRNI